MDHEIRIAPSDVAQTGHDPSAIWLSPGTRRVLDSMADLFVAMDRSLNVVFANRALTELTTPRQGDIVGRNHWDLWPEAKGTGVDEAYTKALATGIPAHFEYRYPGTDVWLDVDAFPSGDYLHVYFRDISEKKRAAADLAERERGLARLLEAIPHIAWATDENGETVYVNGRWEAYTGFPAAGRAEIQRAIHPDDLPSVFGRGEETLDRRPETSYRFRLRRRDGEYRWHEVRVSPLKGEDGKQRSIGTTTDVHEEHLAREALLESQERTTLALSAAGMGTWEVDVLTERAKASPDVAALYGQPAGFAHQSTDDWLAMVHPDDRARLAQARRGLFEYGVAYDERFRVPQADGSVRWLRSKATLFRHPSGAPWKAVGVVADITEEAGREEALVRSDERYRALAELAASVVFTADKEGNLTQIPLLRGLHPSVATTGLGAGWIDAIHPEDRASAMEAWMTAVSSGRNYETDFRVLMASGEYRWHVARAVRVFDPKGNATEWIGACVDVHESRQAEQELRRSENLARTVIGAAASGMAVIATSGELLLTNEAFDLFHFGDQPLSLSDLGQFEPVFEIYSSDGTFVPPDEWPASRALRGERVENVDLRVRRTDIEHEHWGRYSAAPVLGEDGKVIAAVLSVFDITDRVTVERELREAKTRTEGILASADVGTWVLDVPNDRVYADRNLARMFDADEAMADGGPSGEYVARMHPDDRDRVAASLGAAMQDGLPYDVEYRIGNGEPERWVTARGLPERGPDGKVARLPGVVVDVTALKAAQRLAQEAAEALRESSERFRLLVESVPEIAWTSAPDGSLDYYNERWYEYTGRERGSGGDESWTPLLHPDDREATYATWRRSVETGEPYEIELRLRETSTGEYRWFLARARPLRDSDGTIVRWFGITSDIHEQKSREQSLAFLSDLAEAVRPSTDADAIIAACQKMLGEHLGVSRCAYAEVEDDEDTFNILQDWSPGLPSTVGRYSLRLFGKTAESNLRAGRTAVVEHVNRDLESGDGKETFNAIEIEAVVCCALLKEGRLAALLAVHQDRPRSWTKEEIRLIEAVADRCWAEIERARAERALKAANEDLERKVEDRTADLLSAIERLQGFTYHVSHDLRAPLRAISSTSHVVREDYGDLLPKEAHELLMRQADAATRLGQLVDDLLKTSRLSRQEMVRHPVNLTYLARDASAEALSTHPYSTVELEIADGLATEGDPRLLRLALLNLVENAVKYSPRGGTVRIGRREDGAFYVSDEGIGIEPRYFAKIFEPFQRLHLDTEFAGTGIGLANVRQVVERHGGLVWVESELGKGSTFLFTLG